MVPVPKRGEARLVLEQRRDPSLSEDLRIIRGGLRSGDKLYFEWIEDFRDPDDPKIRGCRLLALRNGRLLLWESRGPLREGGGRFLYTPYLTDTRLMESFACLIAASTGNAVLRLLQIRANSRYFTLCEAGDDSFKLAPGDRMVFGRTPGMLEIEREERTLFTPYIPSKGDVFFGSNVEYLTLPHHPAVVARILAEANGLRSECGGGRDLFTCTLK